MDATLTRILAIERRLSSLDANTYEQKSRAMLGFQFAGWVGNEDQQTDQTGGLTHSSTVGPLLYGVQVFDGCSNNPFSGAKVYWLDAAGNTLRQDVAGGDGTAFFLSKDGNDRVSTYLIGSDGYNNATGTPSSGVPGTTFTPTVVTLGVNKIDHACYNFGVHAVNSVSVSDKHGNTTLNPSGLNDGSFYGTTTDGPLGFAYAFYLSLEGSVCFGVACVFGAPPNPATVSPSFIFPAGSQTATFTVSSTTACYNAGDTIVVSL
jgi:hypothetical protein